jgi:hypothetical protein
MDQKGSKRTKNASKRDQKEKPPLKINSVDVRSSNRESDATAFILFTIGIFKFNICVCIEKPQMMVNTARWLG